MAGCPLAATVSIGVACGQPGADIMVLIAAADVALYRAKDNGRNRVELSDEMPATATGAPATAPAGSAQAPALAS